jgi:hypothetical protein
MLLLKLKCKCGVSFIVSLGTVMGSLGGCRPSKGKAVVLWDTMKRKFCLSIQNCWVLGGKCVI